MVKDKSNNLLKMKFLVYAFPLEKQSMHPASIFGLILGFIVLLKIALPDLLYFIPKSCIYLASIYAIGLMVWNWNRMEAIPTNAIGTLILNQDSIQLLETVYSTTTLRSIEINAFDYKGRIITTSYLLSPKKSNGLHNVIKITKSDGTSISANFLQTKSNHISSAKPILISYHDEGLLSTYNLNSLVKS